MAARHYKYRVYVVMRRLLGLLRGGGESATSPLYRVLVVVSTLVLLTSLGFYLCERPYNEALTYGDALWWSVVTMTTVGYGDFYPQSWAGRWLFGLPAMLMGIGVLGYLISLVATVLIERRTRRVKGLAPYTKSDHVIICHSPGTDAVLQIVAEVRADEAWSGCDVVLVSEQFDELPVELQRAGVIFVKGCASRQKVLGAAGAERARRALVFTAGAWDDSADNETLGVVVTLKILNPDLFIVAECSRAENEPLLQNAGATEVVGIGSLAPHMMVQSMQDPGFNAVVSNLLTNVAGHQLYIESVGEFRGTYGELRAKLETQEGVLPLGLVLDGTAALLPPPSTPIEARHRLVFIGTRRLTEL